MPRDFFGLFAISSRSASSLGPPIPAQRRPSKIEGVRLGEATAWLDEYRQFWERRYRALDELLGQLQAKPAKSKRKRH